MRTLSFDKDTIVVGGCIRALLYAFFHELPVVFTKPNPPFRFDTFPNCDANILGLEEKERTQLEVWERIVFLLGMSGNLPISGLDNKLRILDNTLTVTSGNTATKFNFNKLVIFDDKQVKGLPRVKREEKEKNTVIDWVNVRSGCSHDIPYLVDNEGLFVNKIIFYPTERSDNKKNKDLVAISHLTDEQLQDFDFSDTMARFKILKMMKAAGIRGARNGRDVKNPEKYKYYAVKVEPAERVVVNNNKRFYEPDDRLEFKYETLEEILYAGEKPKGYLKKLCEAF
jgi:hypothetical protein